MHPTHNMIIRIGTAAWTLPKQHSDHFPVEGSHLQRYASRFNSVEINSSFHRPHRRKTWERWAASTPDSFRFAVKLPKVITHAMKLANCGAQLQTFFDQANGLNAGPVPKFGPLLIQLPPSLAFDAGVAHEFFTTLRELHTMQAVLEPRHPTWFTPAADRLLRDFNVARVAADPPAGSPLAAQPSGWAGLRYFRLHGSPRTYYSDYSEAFLTRLAQTIREPQSVSPETWIIFDNTALGHATSNAVTLSASLHKPA